MCPRSPILKMAVPLEFHSVYWEPALLSPVMLYHPPPRETHHMSPLPCPPGGRGSDDSKHVTQSHRAA